MAKLGISTGIVPDDGLRVIVFWMVLSKLIATLSDIYTYFGDGTNLTCDWWSLVSILQLV
jgi:hypothetical protein